MNPLLAKLLELRKECVKEYIKDLEKEQVKYNVCYDAIDRDFQEGTIDLEGLELIKKNLKQRETLCKLLILAWKQMLMNFNKKMIDLILDKYDTQAGEYLEMVNEITISGVMDESDYLIECNYFKEERDKIRFLLKNFTQYQNIYS